MTPILWIIIKSLSRAVSDLPLIEPGGHESCRRLSGTPVLSSGYGDMSPAGVCSPEEQSLSSPYNEMDQLSTFTN